MNKEKIIAVIEAEKALIAGVFQDSLVTRCGHPGRCVIGALLVAAGAPFEEVVDRYSIDVGDSRARRLKKVYGIIFTDIERFYSFNDSADTNDFAEECNLTSGPQWKKDRGRACAVIKEIQRM